MQAMELSVELYKVVNENEFDVKITQYSEKKNFLHDFQSVSRDVTLEQANFLIFPLEIARIISVLIQGTDHDGNKAGTLKEVSIKCQYY